jgi:hypothetical protein
MARRLEAVNADILIDPRFGRNVADVTRSWTMPPFAGTAFLSLSIHDIARLKRGLIGLHGLTAPLIASADSLRRGSGQVAIAVTVQNGRNGSSLHPEGVVIPAGTPLSITDEAPYNGQPLLRLTELTPQEVALRDVYAMVASPGTTVPTHAEILAAALARSRSNVNTDLLRTPALANAVDTAVQQQVILTTPAQRLRAYSMVNETDRGVLTSALAGLNGAGTHLLASTSWQAPGPGQVGLDFRLLTARPAGTGAGSGVVIPAGTPLALHREDTDDGRPVLVFRELTTNDLHARDLATAAGHTIGSTVPTSEEILTTLLQRAATGANSALVNNPALSTSMANALQRQQRPAYTGTAYSIIPLDALNGFRQALTGLTGAPGPLVASTVRPGLYDGHARLRFALRNAINLDNLLAGGVAIPSSVRLAITSETVRGLVTWVDVHELTADDDAVVALARSAHMTLGHQVPTRPEILTSLLARHSTGANADLLADNNLAQAMTNTVASLQPTPQTFRGTVPFVVDAGQVDPLTAALTRPGPDRPPLMATSSHGVDANPGQTVFQLTLTRGLDAGNLSPQGVIIPPSVEFGISERTAHMGIPIVRMRELHAADLALREMDRSAGRPDPAMLEPVATQLQRLLNRPLGTINTGALTDRSFATALDTVTTAVTVPAAFDHVSIEAYQGTVYVALSPAERDAHPGLLGVGGGRVPLVGVRRSHHVPQGLVWVAYTVNGAWELSLNGTWVRPILIPASAVLTSLGYTSR